MSGRISVAEKLQALDQFYQESFGEVAPVAPVLTSESYARKIQRLAAKGRRTGEEILRLCELVEQVRAAFKIMDDLIDEDEIRDFQPAFWVRYGARATIKQAAWHLHQARTLALVLNCLTFETRFCEVIAAARLEVLLEDTSSHESQQARLAPAAMWLRIVEKEAAFRRFLAEALGCSPEVCDAAHRDGIAAQILDDARAVLYGKDGRPENSDERLGRLTYMRAYQVSAQQAEQQGLALKTQGAREMEAANRRNPKAGESNE